MGLVARARGDVLSFDPGLYPTLPFTSPAVHISRAFHPTGRGEARDSVLRGKAGLGEGNEGQGNCVRPTGH